MITILFAPFRLLIEFTSFEQSSEVTLIIEIYVISYKKYFKEEKYSLSQGVFIRFADRTDRETCCKFKRSEV